jgi:hypothetical protein
MHDEPQRTAFVSCYYNGSKHYKVVWLSQFIVGVAPFEARQPTSYSSSSGDQSDRKHSICMQLPQPLPHRVY